MVWKMKRAVAADLLVEAVAMELLLVAEMAELGH